MRGDDMNILVFVHDFVEFVPTVSAVGLAASLRDNHGHDVVRSATPGPMVKRIT